MKGVEYEKIYVDDDVQKRKELIEKTGVMSVPITTDGTSYVVGWNPSQLIALINGQK